MRFLLPLGVLLLPPTRPKGYLQSREGGSDLPDGDTQENDKPSTPPCLQNCLAGDPRTQKKNMYIGGWGFTQTGKSEWFLRA